MPKVWLLSSGNAGDENQMKMLAEALGWPYQLKRSRPPITSVASHRIFGVRRLGNDTRDTALFAPPWPDIIISSGGRNVGIARRIRELSGGRTKLVQIGRPWARFDKFDLIITTPQYRLPERANVLHNSAPFNRASDASVSGISQQTIESLGHLRRPYIVVLVGGNSGSYYLDVASAHRMAARLNTLADKHRGSLLVTTSARTPLSAADALFAGISAPALYYRWTPKDPNNPYLNYLALADMFVVTGDSASMLADACGTGRDVLLYDIPQRLRSRLSINVTEKIRGAADGHSRLMRMVGNWYRSLTDRGLLMSPRNLHACHQELWARGLLWRHNESRPALERHPLADLSQALERIHTLLEDQRPGEIHPVNK